MPHPKNKMTTPHEVLHNWKPNALKIKKFSCDAYAHVKQNNKLSISSKRYVFVGISRNQKRWNLWNPLTNKVEVRYHVTFHENSFKNVSMPNNPLDARNFLEISVGDPNNVAVDDLPVDLDINDHTDGGERQGLVDSFESKSDDGATDDTSMLENAASESESIVPILESENDSVFADED